MDVSKIKKAPYNPRIMSKESKKALSKSVDKFGDISGIVINERTSNIIAGNHRWDKLTSKYGKKLRFIQLDENGEFCLIMHKNESTGFIARFVDWDLETEKAANITANSDLISGEFTSDLQIILDDIAPTLMDDFEELRLDELAIDLDDFGDDAWTDAQIDGVKKSSEKSNVVPIGDSGDMDAPSQVNEILTTIKITVPGEIKDELVIDLKSWLSRKKQYKDVIVRTK